MADFSHLEFDAATIDLRQAAEALKEYGVILVRQALDRTYLSRIAAMVYGKLLLVDEDLLDRGGEKLFTDENVRGEDQVYDNLWYYQQGQYPLDWFAPMPEFDPLYSHELTAGIPSTYFGLEDFLVSVGFIHRMNPSMPCIPFHQDGSYMVQPEAYLNIWFPLNTCGVDAPGLEYVPRKEPIIHSVKPKLNTFSQGTYDCYELDSSITQPLEEYYWHPEVRLGDFFIHNASVIHRGYSVPGMRRERLSINYICRTPFANPPSTFVPVSVSQRRQAVAAGVNGSKPDSGQDLDQQDLGQNQGSDLDRFIAATNLPAFTGEQGALERLQAQLQQTQAELAQAQASIQSIQEVQSALQQTQTWLQQTQAELQQAQAEVARSHTLIQAMESSKFWKFRQTWINFKKLIGR